MRLRALAKLEHLRDRLRGALWLVPSAAAVIAVLGAKLLPMAEDRVVEASGGAWYLFGGQADSARELLSTIASAMMTFTGLVFSITILVLQLASSQFSPRVLRTFVEDRSTQLAMATFIGTFVYAMALLPEVRGEDAFGGERVPAFSVFLSFVLVLLSVGVFIRYIHAMAQSVRAVHMIRRVARDASESLGTVYPERVAREPAAPPPGPQGRPSQTVAHDGSLGAVLAAVDEKALLAFAVREGAVIELLPQLGDFVVRGAPLFHVWAPAEVDLDALAGMVLLADERTPRQDPAFGVRQLVDVAERALSPGTNDPTTAVQAIDLIHDLLRTLAPRTFPSEQRVDDEGALRLVLHRPSWDDLVHLAFDEIRHYGRESIQVVRRLRVALRDLKTVCSPERQPVLDAELAAVERLADAFEEIDRMRPSEARKKSA